MTVLAVDPLVTHTYTGAATFAYSFKLFEDDEVLVTFIDASGNRTAKTLTTHYSVSKNSDYQGGSVTTNFAGTGYLELKLNSPFEQDVALASGGPLVLSVLEKMMDKIVGRLQVLNYYVANSLSLPSFLGSWQTSYAYSVGDLVIGDGGADLYHCKTSHTSGTFTTDAAAGKWEVVLSESDIGVAVGLPAIVAGDAKKALRVNAAETGYEFAHVIPKATTGTNDKIPVVNIGETEYELIQAPEVPSPRAKFEYSATNALKIYGYAKYWLYGKGWLYIDAASAITKTFTAISGTGYWHYLYLDYSAITQRDLDAASYFVDSTSIPAYSVTKGGWYNGDDRLIFAVRIDGSGNITKFWHHGDELVQRDDIVTERSYAAMGASWTTVSFGQTLPPCCNEVYFSQYMSDTTAAAILTIRPTGSAATSGIRIGRTAATASQWDNSTIRSYVGTSRSIDFLSSDGANTSLEVHGNGFFLPQQI